MARIIDSVLVDDDRGEQSTELDQHMPVAAIAGETRGLDREHRADVSGADCADQTIKAGAGDAASRAAKVIIDDLDASPAELPSAIGERILAALALLVVDGSGGISAPWRSSARNCARDGRLPPS